MDPLEKAITRFAGVAREEVLRGHIQASCVVSTWVSVAVFRELGYPATHREVVASVGNSVYAHLWRRFGHPPRGEAEFARWCDAGAFVAGIGHDQLSGGIGGHLICTVGDQVVIDASLDQAADPSHQLFIPSVVSFPIDPRGLAKGIIRLVDDHIFIEYVDRPTISDYTSSPDWGGSPEARQAVQRIIARMTGSTE